MWIAPALAQQTPDSGSSPERAQRGGAPLRWAFIAWSPPRRIAFAQTVE